MASLLSKLIAKSGKHPSDFRAGSRLGNIFRQNGVPHSDELTRIVRMPRRTWQPDEVFARELTEYLKQPLGEMVLRPVQAVALSEMYEQGGLFGPQRVGCGKTLVSLLAPVVLDAKRVLLLVPAKLRDKTRRDIAKLELHWKIDGVRIRIESYEMLGRVQAAEMLESYQPDLIIADECHKLRNSAAAVVRRTKRWMKDHPETKFVALSGTITKRSLHDYAHLLRWCLPKGAPVPKTFNELREWADAVDEKVDPIRRLAPGALEVLFDDDDKKLAEHDEVAAARRTFQRRLCETAGVVATSEVNVDCSLVIEMVEQTLGPKIDDAFVRLREDGETPDGHPVSDHVSLWRHARELAIGFYYRWNPRPPELWLERRRTWCKFVRAVIAGKVETSRPLDSELHVAQYFAGHPDHLAWKNVKDTFKPVVEPVWIDDGAITFAKNWLEQGPGICWVEHVAFGERLSAMTGVPYYASQGRNQAGVAIEDADPDKPLIASIASNAEGRNLQAWNRNLIASCPPTGTIVEQLIGRTHRDGQEADEVTVEIMIACIEQLQGFEQARRDAEYLGATLGQPQKLTYADVVVPSVREFSRPGVRWNRNEN